MERLDLEEPVFDETEMERLMALTGTHGVLYGQAAWRVTVEMLTSDIVAFMLTPLDFSPHDQHPIGFYHYIGTGKLCFTFGNKWDLSLVRAFLNAYVPCELKKFRE